MGENNPLRDRKRKLLSGNGKYPFDFLIKEDERWEKDVRSVTGRS